MRSSSIIGGAQVISIVVGLLRMKALAMLLGPAGVGLAGLYQSIIQTGTTIASLGVGTVGTRQVAEARSEGGDLAVGRTRRSLFWGAAILSSIGTILFWLSSGWIARSVLADESKANDVAWLSVGVGLSVAAASQGALLAGLRRIGDQARIALLGAVISTAFGIAALWVWGAQGLLVLVMLVPAVSFLLGHFYVGRLGLPAGPASNLTDMVREWRTMLTLGFTFMLSGLVVVLGQLFVRTLVQRELGVEALGQFQAAWAIGMTYLGFVLTAMGADYYPRLTAAIKDHPTAVRLVNEQTEVALLLSAPILLAMLGLAPWVVRLLYSAEFGPAAEILRWQLLGDLLKVISWPLGFVILATGAGKTFLMVEALTMGVFVLGVMIGLPLVGVTATGVAFLLMYVVLLPVVWWLAVRRIGFCWSPTVQRLAAAVIAAAVVVDVAGRWSDPAGAILGALLATGAALWALARLSEMTEVGGVLGKIGAVGKRVRKWVARQL